MTAPELDPEILARAIKAAGIIHLTSHLVDVPRSARPDEIRAAALDQPNAVLAALVDAHDERWENVGRMRTEIDDTRSQLTKLRRGLAALVEAAPAETGQLRLLLDPEAA